MQRVALAVESSRDAVLVAGIRQVCSSPVRADGDEPLQLRCGGLVQEELQGLTSERMASDELASTLLPVLIHRMNNATQLMSNLSALARCGPAPGGVDWIEERAEDLAGTSREVDVLGYLLAVLASASGAKLLLERRAARGLEWMTEAVGEALHREGRALAPAARAVPDQSPRVANGWELCWAVGALLLAAGESSSADAPLEWQWLEQGESWVLVCAGEAPAGVTRLRALLTSRLPESSLDLRSEGWSWRVPAAWMGAAAGD